MTERVTIDGYSKLLRDLKKLAPEVDKELRTGLRALGTTVATSAKQNAGRSKRIPSAIGVSVTNKGAAVKVNRRKAPHGSLYERGSKGNRGAIRHPLFGNREHWYATPTRPFIKPAIDSHRDEIERAGERLLKE